MDNDYYNDPATFPDDMPTEIQDHINSQSDKNQVCPYVVPEVNNEGPVSRFSQKLIKKNKLKLFLKTFSSQLT